MEGLPNVTPTRSLLSHKASQLGGADMFKILMAVCLAVMTPQGPRFVNCNVMVEQPERWYQSEEECSARVEELQGQYSDHFEGTPMVARVACLPKERLEEIENDHRRRIPAKFPRGFT